MVTLPMAQEALAHRLGPPDDAGHENGVEYAVWTVGDADVGVEAQAGGREVHLYATTGEAADSWLLTGGLKDDVVYTLTDAIHAAETWLSERGITLPRSP